MGKVNNKSAGNQKKRELPYRKCRKSNEDESKKPSPEVEVVDLIDDPLETEEARNTSSADAEGAATVTFDYEVLKKFEAKEKTDVLKVGNYHNHHIFYACICVP